MRQLSTIYVFVDTTCAYQVVLTHRFFSFSLRTLPLYYCRRRSPQHVAVIRLGERYQRDELLLLLVSLFVLSELVFHYCFTGKRKRNKSVTDTDIYECCCLNNTNKTNGQDRKDCYIILLYFAFYSLYL